MKKNFIVLFVEITSLLFCSSVYYAQENERVKYELPEIADSSEIVSHVAYTLNYKERYEQAEWVAYLLTKDMITTENERENNFREDPLVETGSAKPSEYARSGYDKGHLAPAADMGLTKETMSESFYMSNMSPQKPGFNRGIWKKLEEQVREFAKEYDSIYIATGPVFCHGMVHDNKKETDSKSHGGVHDFEFKRIGKSKVAVPEYYYKVIAVYKHNDHKGIGFVLANESSKDDLKSFAFTIDSVETLTGINFFAKIPKKIQDKIESKCNVGEWIKESTGVKE